MHCRNLAVVLLPTLTGWATASLADTWSVAAARPCMGLTARWTQPLAEIRAVLGSQWQPLPGPAPGQSRVMLFIAACPDSRLDSRATGPFTAAFTLVPVRPIALDARAPPPRAAHWIAVLAAAGDTASPLLQRLRRAAVPIIAAQISLQVQTAAGGKHVAATLRTAQGALLTLSADFEGPGVRFASRDTTVVRVAPPGVVFRGAERALRYRHTRGPVSLQRIWLMNRLFNMNMPGVAPRIEPVQATLDTQFVWQFEFTPPVRAVSAVNKCRESTAMSGGSTPGRLRQAPPSRPPPPRGCDRDTQPPPRRR